MTSSVIIINAIPPPATASAPFTINALTLAGDGAVMLSEPKASLKVGENSTLMVEAGRTTLMVEWDQSAEVDHVLRGIIFRSPAQNNNPIRMVVQSVKDDIVTNIKVAWLDDGTEVQLTAEPGVRVVVSEGRRGEIVTDIGLGPEPTAAEQPITAAEAPIAVIGHEVDRPTPQAAAPIPA
jgi:hypothetical protein